MDRRHFLSALAASGAFFTQRGAFAQSLVLTPSTTEGPYYPDQLPLDQDNDLIILNDHLTPAIGTPAWVSGRVLDRNGLPARGALVEIWGADDYGSYIHSRGANAANGNRKDGNYQGYGRFLTASDGQYLFRIVKPGLYPGRTRHMHFKITFANGGGSLTTQLMFEGEAQNANDNILTGIRDAAQRASVIRPLVPIPDSPSGSLACSFDIAMGFTPSDATAVVHGATMHAGAASKSWVTVFGTGFSEPADVRFNGQPASTGYVSANQINVISPDLSVDTQAQVTVSTPSGTTNPVSVNVKKYMPGFFEAGDQYALADPVKPGDTVTLSGTGFGTSALGDLPEKVSVRVGAAEAEVVSAKVVSDGVTQVSFVVPALESGDQPVIASVAGVWTAKFVRLRIG